MAQQKAAATEFKVSLQGIELTPEQRDRINGAVQRTVLAELATLKFPRGWPVIRFPREWWGIIIGPTIPESEIDRLGG